MIARSKLNCIKTMISQALLDSEVTYKEYTTIINEEENFRRLKEHVRMIKSERSNSEKDKLMEEDKKMGINMERHTGKEILFLKLEKRK